MTWGQSAANVIEKLKLHIGYIYGSTEAPANSGEYQPKYIPGARLPHVWIRLLNPEIIEGIAPTDLTHIQELSDEAKAMRQYSVLDLCKLDKYTLIVNSSKGQQSRANQITDLVATINKDGIAPCLQTFALRRDFEVVFEMQAKEWLEEFQLNDGQHGGVLVRPDQHVLFMLTESTTPEEVASVVRHAVGHEHV